MDSSKKNYVWKFTNGTELDEAKFLDYVERKVFKTIRRFQMLKNTGTHEISISGDKKLNTRVLNFILSKKFKTAPSKKPSFDSKNLSDLSEKIFSRVLRGKIDDVIQKEIVAFPLCFLSDREIELYAQLNSLDGIRKKRNKRIQELFSRFVAKNPDLEHNILNAQRQIIW
jgi:hypothetical protein